MKAEPQKSAITKDYQTNKPKTKKLSLNSIGFFVNWDENSFTSLKQNINSLDILMPEWLALSKNGRISIDDLSKQKQVLSYVKKQQKNLKIMPLINNFNSVTQSWDSNLLKAVITSKKDRNNLINELFKYVILNNFAGINIDFESVPPESHKELIEFISELSAKFHTKNLKVSQCVPVDNSEFDYKTLAKFNDYLVLMDYDEHWSTGVPGPIVSQQWYSDEIKKRSLDIPPEKMIIAIANYGYDWNTKAKAATGITFQETMKIVKSHKSKIIFDSKSLNPTFDYYDKAKSLHHVWFLDSITVFNQLSEANKYKPFGFALWRLGAEDPSMWQIFDSDKNNSFSKSSLNKLEAIQYPNNKFQGKRKLKIDNNKKIIIKEIYNFD